MPVYELEILEPEGGVTRAEYVSPAGVSYDVNDSFEYDGRTLRVRMLEETEYTGTDERLVCAVEQPQSRLLDAGRHETMGQSHSEPGGT
jgi:hypothetical protein